MALYRIYLERDAALLEVNPLIVTKKATSFNSSPS